MTQPRSHHRLAATVFTRFWAGVTMLTLAVSCSQSGAPPTAPSAISGDASAIASSLGGDSVFGALDVIFPPRDQALRFRQQLEAYYRDVLRRGASPSFVDLEGTIVWTQEYLRLRVNGCGHSEAVGKVLSLIDGVAGAGAVCSTLETPFPPRNEPLLFRQALEAKYRDGLRRGAIQTFVDAEGDIVWTQEYFRYRTLGCTDIEASTRVIEQVAGAPPSSTCSNCPLSLSEVAVTFDRTGGSRNVSVTTPGGCGWTAVSDMPWLRVTSGASGNGNGTVRYELDALAPPAERNGTITIGSQVLRVKQVATADPPLVADFQMRQGGAVTDSCNVGSGQPPCVLEYLGSTANIASYDWTVSSSSINTSYSGQTVTLDRPGCGFAGTSQLVAINLTIRNNAGVSATTGPRNHLFTKGGCG